MGWWRFSRLADHLELALRWEYAARMSDRHPVGGDGAKIGPGNEFAGMFQAECCDAHSDPLRRIQIYGGNPYTRDR